MRNHKGNTNRNHHKSGMLKTTFREIRSSFGRFFAIFAIIALGVGFFAGLKITKGAMTATVENYLEDHGFFDLRLLSTLGFEQEDLDSFARQRRDIIVEGGISFDILYRTEDGNQGALKTYSLTQNLNTVKLVAGRLPLQSDECVADSVVFGEDAIGSTLYLAQDNAEEDKERFVHNAYKIVGLVQSPLYLQYERGNTSLGNGRLDGFVYLLPEGYDTEYYTEVYVRYCSQQDYGLYSDVYKDFIKEQTDMWETAVDSAADRRYQKILADARDELADAEKELADKRAEGEAELADAAAELADARVKAADGEQEIADAKKEIADNEEKLREAEDELADAKAQIAEKETELADGELQLAEKAAELADAETLLAEKTAELADGEAQFAEKAAEFADAEALFAEKAAEFADGERQLAEAGKALADAEALIAEKKAELEAGETQLAEGRKQWEEGKKSLESAGKEAEAGRAQLEAGRAQLEAGKAQLQASGLTGEPLKAALAAIAAQEKELDVKDAELKAVEAQISMGLKELEANEAELAAAEREIAAGRAELAAAGEEIAAGSQEIEKAWAELEEGRTALTEAREELEDGRAKLLEALAELEDGRAKLLEAQEELEDGRAKLLEAQEELADGRAALLEALEELADGEKEIAEGRQKLDEAKGDLLQGEEELADGKKELADGEKEYADALLEFQEKIGDAEKELADAKEELEKLESPDTYVLGRDTNIGYVCFENDSNIVEGIANIFPVFFFLVAALVCITTMNRMVEEQRTQIGVLKALGYGETAIMSKYMIYSGLAALAGCVSGYLIGTWGFPKVIWFTYGLMYRADPISYVFDRKLAVISLAVSLLCSIGTTWLSCRVELKEASAVLMRPKAPKAGKRILLERIPFLWNRLGFLRKVSLRNIFRYKKRLFMMVLGISGCTALLVTGFGIKDSIADVAQMQFHEIQIYDISVDLKEGADAGFLNKLDAIAGQYDVEAYVPVMERTFDLVAQEGVKSVYLVVGTAESMPDFLDMHTTDGEAIPYPGTGEAVISNKLADVYHVAPGDTITLRDENMKNLTLTVSAVYENYIYNYVQISEETWRRFMGLEPERKTVYINIGETADAHGLSAALMGFEEVANVTVNTDIMDRVTNMMASLDLIVVVVVLCAAGLAFIVLYNLTNINITERIREIATIKVLGFYKKETASYVFRENILLTVLGAIVGLLLGRFLHGFVMSRIQVDLISFDVYIKPISYGYSFMLTLVFTFLVNKVMGGKLEKISMTESLKSVD